jgi:hypothetical protein
MKLAVGPTALSDDRSRVAVWAPGRSPPWQVEDAEARVAVAWEKSVATRATRPCVPRARML